MIETLNVQDTFERFVTLTKLAKLRRRQSNRGPSFDLELMEKEGDARETAVRYSAECVALELSKADPAKFSPLVQTRFTAIGRIVDAHIPSGPDGIHQRRALIERAEEFAAFSPHQESLNATDDNQEIADRLNASGVSAGVARFLLARELGQRGLKPPKDVHDVDTPFTAEQARKLTDELGHLHQEIRTRLRTVDDLFADRSNDRVAWGDGAIRDEILEFSRKVARKPVDPSLSRIKDELLEEKERDKRAVSNDSWLSSGSSIVPAATDKRRKHADILSDGDSDTELEHAPRRRRLGSQVRSLDAPVADPVSPVVSQVSGRREGSMRGERQDSMPNRLDDRSRDRGLCD